MEIVFIKRVYEGIKVYYDQKVNVLDVSIYKFLNDICIDNLSTYKGRIDAIKRKYNIKSLVPLYVSEDCLLIPTTSIRNYECIWINYFQIQKIKTSEILMNNNCIIKVRKNLFLKQIKRCEEIAF
ncbi:competence protein ComK [Mycoplasmatota bacterium]|nr:competence protein ComK [Mycoplasmatota bacterium]